MTYHYYFLSPRQEGGKMLLLIHGFQDSSFDWHHQVTYLEERGYGLIVPDMLGYGGSSEPTDPNAYRHSLIANDLKDILDAEHIQQAIVIGHDCNCSLGHIPPRACSGLGLSYCGILTPPPPGAKFDLNACNERTKKGFGYEVFGYWEFFSASDAGEVTRANFETMFDIIFPANYEMRKTDFIPERARITETLQKGGFEAPSCYYKVQTSGNQTEDAQQIPSEKRDFPKMPIFLGDTLKDPAAREELILCAFGIPESPLTGENVTKKAFHAGHWLMFEKPNEVSEALNGWLESF
ncbi:epoxide hydrolase [Moniliophthora roreri MCA 2997]|uniref:Epoxide hydrolase n=1 Tax=Moniliophthora roreri (strain MCA 2997) TaxID=1381753 RepID=V2WQ57_MONRO|nr:epoxide hydrolase [Moniliophthora roreri MCA 2997]